MTIITVTIPHLNDPDALSHCLESLARQQGVRSEVEILVVDNGSDVLPTDVCARWPNVRLLQEPTPGPGPARNLGVAEAKGDILAFTDSDCQVDIGWIARIETAFEQGDPPIIGGDILVPIPNPENPRFIEPFEAIYSFRNAEHIRDGFSASSNLATRPWVFEKVGGFGGIGIAEDQEWGIRATELGLPATFIPDMIVYHPARPDMAALKQKWDRHINHDFNVLPKSGLARVRWVVKALALIPSPVAEIKTIFTSSRLTTFKQRVLAFCCLVYIRCYRSMQMLGILIKGQGAKIKWNESN